MRRTMFTIVWTVSLTLLSGCLLSVHSGVGGTFDVRRYGATGEGTTLDTAAVNDAIAAANAAGGGVVCFPAGRYACHTIHLRSNVTLALGPGAVLLAAPPAPPGSRGPSYDPPEPNPSDSYQDFGHSHFHNSLICGENVENVTIVGPGCIDGSAGLSRGSDNGPDTTAAAKAAGAALPVHTDADPPDRTPLYPSVRDTLRDGVGNKAISLKLCRNVTLRDVAIRAGGHFAILATGVDGLTIDNLRIDTNRDGMDIDSCRDVRVSNCTVNSPWDDGICLKSDFALGYSRPCQDVTITNCQVSGWACGSLLDGTHRPFGGDNDGGGGGTGRIKFGTESNGGFLNVTISNCVFDSCRGIALETVDGGNLEDVAIDNVTMRHPVNSPIFLRIGARRRGPLDVTPIGELRRITISNVVVSDADPRYASIIAGLPGHPVQDVKISHVDIATRGGGADVTAGWATTRPAELAGKYPEPAMFGPTAAYGFYVRHADGVRFTDVTLRTAVAGDEDDADDAGELRPPFVFDDVTNAAFADVDAQHAAGVPVLSARTPTTRMTSRDSPGVRPTTGPASQP